MIDRSQDARHSGRPSGGFMPPSCLELALRNPSWQRPCVTATTDRTYERNRFDPHTANSCKQGAVHIWDVTRALDPVSPPQPGGGDLAPLTRALPAPACPSPGNAPPGPVVVPVSMMPEAARERTVSFRPRAPHSLRVREYPRPKASVDERDSRLVAEMGTDVKGIVIAEVTIAEAITRPPAPRHRRA